MSVGASARAGIFFCGDEYTDKLNGHIHIESFIKCFNILAGRG